MKYAAVPGFLDLPWDDRLLQHEKFVHNVSMLNKYEASSVQVVKPIHTESLTAWEKMVLSSRRNTLQLCITIVNC
ncbi:unnamed protein product [Heterobilharzia americana]|nr:unnamed protein product [Heterobilharzia americana]